MKITFQTRISLNNGLSIPALGLGTSRQKSGKVKNAIAVAIDIGYRHIDCAAKYENEAEVGEVLSKKINEVGRLFLHFVVELKK